MVNTIASSHCSLRTHAQWIRGDSPARSLSKCTQSLSYISFVSKRNTVKTRPCSNLSLHTLGRVFQLCVCPASKNTIQPSVLSLDIHHSGCQVLMCKGDKAILSEKKFPAEIYNLINKGSSCRGKIYFID